MSPSYFLKQTWMIFLAIFLLMPKQATRPPKQTHKICYPCLLPIGLTFQKHVHGRSQSWWSLCHHGSCSSGHPPCLPLCWLELASFLATNFPHGALFRWPRWASLIINQKNIFAFKGCIMFTFMHQFKVILHMHSLTKLKQCLRLQYNLQLNKPQNK